MVRATKGVEGEDGYTFNTWHNVVLYVTMDIAPKRRPPNGGRIISIRIAEVQHMIDLDIPDDWDVVYIMDQYGDTVDSFRAPVWKNANTKETEVKSSQVQTSQEVT